MKERAKEQQKERTEEIKREKLCTVAGTKFWAEGFEEC